MIDAMELKRILTGPSFSQFSEHTAATAEHSAPYIQN
jgi:hypothetical protein